jgi:cysteine-rich repeat protein
MAQKSRLSQLVFAAVLAVCMNGSLLAAWGKARAPAGQMCAMGSYVIGFDAEANIICTEACGNGVLNPGETCDDGNTESGDNCPATCQSEGAESGSVNEEVAEESIPADTVNPATTSVAIISEPAITGMKPSKLVYGAREMAITVIGTGFHTDSVIIFNGTKYSPSVNSAGTQLKVTIPTRSLSIGPYAITVSNGPGMETTLKRALEIY